MRTVVCFVLRMLALACVLLLASDGGRAWAQSPAAIDFEAAFAPDFLRRDVPTFKSMLALDDEQTSIIEALVHDYNEAFEQALRGVREDLRQAQAAMGFEDPEIDQRREALRQEIATVFEAMSQELENLPAGASAAEMRTKYEEQIKQLQASLQQLQASPVQSNQLAKLFDDASLRLEQWRAERKAIREKFVSNAQAILHKEQTELWPALERRLLRERAIGQSLLQGEGVDLLMLVKDQKLTPPQRQTLASALTDYEMALDAALRGRVDLIESSEREIFKAVQRPNADALQTLIERITQARVTVRNVNDDFAGRLASDLGDAGPSLLAAYRLRAYPLVFRDTQTLRLIKAAQEMPGLSLDQAKALEDMRRGYEAELTPTNERVLAAVREHEPAQVTQREVRRLLPPAPEQEEAERDRPIDGMQQAFNARSEIGKVIDARLQSLLGPELYERLPRNQRRPATAPGDSPDSDDPEG